MTKRNDGTIVLNEYAPVVSAMTALKAELRSSMRTDLPKWLSFSSRRLLWMDAMELPRSSQLVWLFILVRSGTQLAQRVRVVDEDLLRP